MKNWQRNDWHLVSSIPSCVEMPSNKKVPQISVFPVRALHSLNCSRLEYRATPVRAWLSVKPGNGDASWIRAYADFAGDFSKGWAVSQE